MGRFKGKVVLVTGGNRNTGLDIVEKFVREGAKVFACGSTEASTAAGAAALKARGVEVQICISSSIGHRDDWTAGNDLPKMVGSDGKAVRTGKKSQPLTASIGVIADPEKIRPGFQEPADFQQFWDNALAELAKVPVKASRQETAVTDDLLPRISTCFSYRTQPQTQPPKTLKGEFRCWDVKVDCVGGVPVSGYLTMPAGARPKSLPAIVTFQGAGVKTANKAFVPGAIRFDVNAHGIENGKDPGFYWNLAKTTLSGYVSKGVENRDKYYFRNMYLRVKRALDYIKTLPEYDGKTLIVAGNSQGGGQALVAGGLDPDVVMLQASVPAMCDHGGALAGRIPGWPHLLQLRNGKIQNRAMARTLPYFDAVFFARRIKGKAYLAVGLVDTTCSPSSIFAAYNAIPGEKHITVLPSNGHRRSVSGLFVRQLEKMLSGSSGQQ